MKFSDAAFMGIMRWTFYNSLKGKYETIGVPVCMTYGYITKHTRIQHNLPKEHYIDARCISGNPTAVSPGEYFYQRKVRCHNRQIHKTKILKGGRRKLNQSAYLVKNFRLFDKVEYQKESYFIFDRRLTGFFDVRRLDGTKINNGSISYKKLKLLETKKYYLTERRIASPPSAKSKGVQRLIGEIMKDEIKRFKAAEIKESLYSILWVTIAAVIILGLSIFAKNATAIFFTVLIYFLWLYLAIKGYFEVADEIESRVLIKELLKEGQVKISLNYRSSEEISVAWIKDEELYSAILHNDKYPITYRQQMKDKRCIEDRQIEIDDNLAVTVIG